MICSGPWVFCCVFLYIITYCTYMYTCTHVLYKHTLWEYVHCVLYIILQARHRDEIEQIRKAGHDSLAMIVEQYKACLLLLECES